MSIRTNDRILYVEYISGDKVVDTVLHNMGTSVEVLEIECDTIRRKYPNSEISVKLKMFPGTQ